MKWFCMVNGTLVYWQSQWEALYNLSITLLLLIYSIEQLSDGFEAGIVYSYTLTLLSLVLEDEKGHFVINRPGL